MKVCNKREAISWNYLKELNKDEVKSELKKIHLESKKVFELANIIQEEVALEPIVLKEQLPFIKNKSYNVLEP